MSSLTPSYTPASYSTNASGHSTRRSQEDPPSDPEEESYNNTDSENEVSSERDPYDGPRVSPTTVLPQPTPSVLEPQPGTTRTRLTARKSVPIPRRVTLTTPRSEAPEPPRVVPGVPVGRMTQLAMEREQHIRAMTTELHGCRVRVTRQGEVLSEVVELAQQLAVVSSQARDGAKMAREMASRSQAASLVVLMMLMMLMFVIVLGAYLG